MTYNVFGGTLSLTQSINRAIVGSGAQLTNDSQGCLNPMKPPWQGHV